MQGGIAVVEELHRLHKVEGFRVEQNALVGHRREQLGERYTLVGGDVAEVGTHVQVSESRQPKAVLGCELESVVEVAVFQDISHFICQAEHRGVLPEVEWRLDALAVVVDIAPRRIAQLERPLRIVVEGSLCGCAIRVVPDVTQSQSVVGVW